jgi:hypothetical protein
MGLLTVFVVPADEPAGGKILGLLGLRNSKVTGYFLFYERAWRVDDGLNTGP